MTLKPYLQDREFLKKLDELVSKDVFVKIILLDIKEEPVQEIQGRVSSGQINIDGESSVRRAGNITFLPDEQEGNLTDVNNLISIEKKVQIELGYKNTLPQYSEYPIIWFPLGVYVITDASSSVSLTGTTISLQLQDKMCLLNGTCGGTIPAATSLHYIDENGDNIAQEEEKIPIYNIIQELVNHFGGEDISKIIISDVEAIARKMVKWNGDAPLLLSQNGDTLGFVPPGAENELIKGARASATPPSGYFQMDFTPAGDAIFNEEWLEFIAYCAEDNDYFGFYLEPEMGNGLLYTLEIYKQNSEWQLWDSNSNRHVSFAPIINEAFKIRLGPSAFQILIDNIVIAEILNPEGFTSSFGGFMEVWGEGGIFYVGPITGASNAIYWDGNSLTDWDASSSVMPYTFELADFPGGGSIIDIFNPNDNIGYQFVPFVFPDELTADAGQTVCNVLDKIKEVLGNYEYFYDLNGNFRFQEIRNYINTSQATVAINQMTKANYLVDGSIQDGFVYNFDNNNLITSFAITPQYSMIKNDYVVWGLKKINNDLNLPIRYHLAIDDKPVPTLVVNGITEDWRNVFYRQGVTVQNYGTNSNPYFVELQNEWPKLYSPDTLEWNPEALANPSDIDYYLDLIGLESSLGELSIGRIGKRSQVINDPDVNCIFPPSAPNIVIVEKGDTQAKNEAILKGYKYVEVEAEFLEGLPMGTNYKDAFTTVRDMLYQSLSYNTGITLQALPIYYLDANTRINVNDEESGINGGYIIKSITLPLSISETMSINAVSALERI